MEVYTSLKDIKEELPNRLDIKLANEVASFFEKEVGVAPPSIQNFAVLTRQLPYR